jgi:hypothetical protein
VTIFLNRVPLTMRFAMCDLLWFQEDSLNFDSVVMVRLCEGNWFLVQNTVTV